MRILALGTFTLMVWAAWGDEAGQVALRSDQGRLTRLETRWRAGDDLAARGWWTENGGSAWVRAWGLQAGPLEGRAASGGEWAWGPSTTATEGRWGLAADLPWVGGWLVQSPGALAAGGFGRAEGGWLSASAGGSRSWDLDTGGPIDEVRAGLRWAPAGWVGSLAWRAVPGDLGDWQARQRLSLGPLRLDVAGHRDETGALNGQLSARWRGLRATAGADSKVGWASASVGWDGGPWAVTALWTAEEGPGGEAQGEVAGIGWKVRGDASVTAVAQSLSVDGRARFDADSWVTAEVAGHHRSAWGATVGLGVSSGNLHGSVSWTTDGQRLGWLVEGSQVRLEVVWGF